MQPSTYKHTAGEKSMVAYVIYQALLELNHKSKKRRREAEEFLKSEDCENYCYGIGFDYELIRKINFENPSESLNFGVKMPKDEILNDDYTEVMGEMITVTI